MIAKKELGENVDSIIKNQLKKDSLDHMMRFLGGVDDSYDVMESDAVQICLDISFDFAAMGRSDDIVTLLSGLEKARPDCRRKPLYFALGYYKKVTGKSEKEDYEKAKAAELGSCYPMRFEEIAILNDVISKTGGTEAKMLLGCLLYNKCHYEKAADLWESAVITISQKEIWQLRISAILVDMTMH